MVIAKPEARSVYETNIPSDEALRYINNPPFTEPQLSGLGRSGVQEASQFHGQDGLGAYAYGYRTPQSSKVENRDRAGEVNGAYTWKAGNDDIKVRYWADNMGFHQVDNLPKPETPAAPQAPQESEAHRLARVHHEKAWIAAATASSPQWVQQQRDKKNQQYQDNWNQQYQNNWNQQNQDQLNQQLYNAEQRDYQQQYFQQQRQQQQARDKYDSEQYDYEGTTSQQQGPQQKLQYLGNGYYGPSSQQRYYRAASESQPHQGKQVQVNTPVFNSQLSASENRKGKAYPSYQNAQQYGNYGQQSNQYRQQQYQRSGSYGNGQQYSQDNYWQPKPTGPGFFYSFDYPVSNIERKYQYSY